MGSSSNPPPQRWRYRCCGGPGPASSTELTRRSKPCRSSPPPPWRWCHFPAISAGMVVSVTGGTCAPPHKRFRWKQHPRGRRLLILDTHPPPFDLWLLPPAPISHTASNNYHLKIERILYFNYSGEIMIYEFLIYEIIWFVDIPIARDMAKTPRTRGPSQKITRPPASWIRFNSSGRSGCKNKQNSISAPWIWIL